MPIMLIFLFLLSACSLAFQSPTPTPTQPPLTPQPILLTSTPETCPTPQGWRELAPCVWEKMVRVEAQYALRDFDMPVVMIDPTGADIRVHYEPTYWYTLAEWRERLPDALAMINGSFFTPEGYAVGLVITDGQVFGNSLEEFGGMLQISGDLVRIRSLVREPYQGELYEQAVQGFPMLIHPGGEPARTGDGFDDPARRTLIAQDKQGRILLMVTPSFRDLMTLRQAQQWLLENGLEIDAAFGLDGGKSSGMMSATGEYPSIDPVPVVIAVYRRG